MRRSFACCAAALLVAFGCGSNEKPKNPSTGAGGTGGSGAAVGSGASGGSGGGAPASPCADNLCIGQPQTDDCELCSASALLLACKAQYDACTMDTVAGGGGMGGTSCLGCADYAVQQLAGDSPMVDQLCGYAGTDPGTGDVLCDPGSSCEIQVAVTSCLCMPSVCG